ncbi:MAG: hypothetical protein AAGJ50_14410, partial [Pseudomonadota bacterium]
MLTHWIRWSLAWFVILLFSTMLYDANAQPRIATIIGNADYVVEKLELRNPVNDANLMASTVSGLGRRARRLKPFAVFIEDPQHLIPRKVCVQAHIKAKPTHRARHQIGVVHGVSQL